MEQCRTGVPYRERVRNEKTSPGESACDAAMRREHALPSAMHLYRLTSNAVISGGVSPRFVSPSWRCSHTSYRLSTCAAVFTSSRNALQPVAGQVRRASRDGSSGQAFLRPPMTTSELPPTRLARVQGESACRECRATKWRPPSWQFSRSLTTQGPCWFRIGSGVFQTWRACFIKLILTTPRHSQKRKVGLRTPMPTFMLGRNVYRLDAGRLRRIARRSHVVTQQVCRMKGEDRHYLSLSLSREPHSCTNGHSLCYRSK